MIKFTGLFLTAMLAASPALALKGNVHDCQFKTSRGEILSDRVVFVVSPDASASRVYDGVVNYAEGKPIDARITEDSTKKLTIQWSVMMHFRGQDARMNFRLSYFKGNKKAVVSSQAVGYTNKDNARGTCSIAKGEL